MRFGLRLPSFALAPDTASLAEMGAYLRRAEDLGFESALLIDHLLVAPPAYRMTWLEPISLLSALAGVTRTIRLGTLVLVLPFRDPVAFAKEWATLDMLSGGRTILGVGVGWHQGDSPPAIPIKERGRRMNEMLEAITALWGGDDGRTRPVLRVRGPGRSTQSRPSELTRRSGSGEDAAVGEDLRPGGRHDPAGPPADRKYASTWVPHSSATAEMVAGDWAVIREEMAPRARPQPMSKVYSNFIHVLAPVESPESAARGSGSSPAWTSTTGRSSTSWARPKPLAERIRGKVEALGKVEEVILNPLDWDAAPSSAPNDSLPPAFAT